HSILNTCHALNEYRTRRTDLVIMAYQQSVTTAAGDARRAHRNSRIAWSVAGVLTIALFLSVTWATHSVTKAHADVSHLSQSVRQLSGAADAKGQESEKLRQEAETARINAARA